MESTNSQGMIILPAISTQTVLFTDLSYREEVIFMPNVIPNVEYLLLFRLAKLHSFPLPSFMISSPQRCLTTEVVNP